MRLVYRLPLTDLHPAPSPHKMQQGTTPALLTSLEYLKLQVMFKTLYGEFFSSPAVRTWHFHCRGPRFRELKARKLVQSQKKKKKHSTNVKYNNNNFLEAQRCQVESQVHWVGQNRTGFCREPPWLTCTLLLSTLFLRGPSVGQVRSFCPGSFSHFSSWKQLREELGVSLLSPVPAGLGRERG